MTTRLLEERLIRRLTLLSISVGLGATLAGCFVAWGAFGARVGTLEEEIKAKASKESVEGLREDVRGLSIRIDRLFEKMGWEERVRR